MSSLPWFTMFLFLISLNFAMNSSTPLCHPNDKLNLLQFRNSFTTDITGPMNQFCASPPEIIESRSSTKGHDCCQWEWVNCDPSTGHVTAIDLHCSGLNGSISSIRNLFQFQHLQSIILSQNYLSGELPSSIKNPEKLLDLWELNLGNNLIYGEVPSWVASLPSLQHLYLGSNRFTGPLVDVLGNASPSLQELGLSGNEFYGSIPDSVFLNLVNLTILDLSSNRLGGSIPQKFSDCDQLVQLKLNDNQLQGVVPRSLLQCKNLQVVDLANNKLVGSFPSWLNALPHLQTLNLSGNKFHGLFMGAKVEHLISGPKSR